MNKTEKILKQIKEIIEESQTPDEEHFHNISENLKSRLEIGIFLEDDLPKGKQMADILSIYSGLSWDAMKSSGVSINIMGNEIIESIIETPMQCHCVKAGARQIMDFAQAFKQIAERLEEKAMMLNPKLKKP